MRFSAFLTFIFLFTSLVSAQELKTFLRYDKESYSAGDTVVIGIKVDIPEKYHLYSNPLGPGIGKPLMLSLDQNGVRWLEVRKSSPEKFVPSVGDWVWAYEGNAYFFVKGVITSDVGSDVKGSINLDALFCYTSCVPVENTTDYHINVGQKLASGSIFTDEFRAQLRNSESMEFKIRDAVNETLSKTASGLLGLEGLSGLNEKKSVTDAAVGDASETAFKWSYSPIEEKRDYNLFTALLFSLLAGLALNITPCIFPMLGIRVLSFAQGAGESRRLAVVRSLIFSAGIVAVFMILASLAAFAGFSWGQQFQSPLIVTVIIALIFLFALGMFDFYTLLVPSRLANMDRKSGGLTGDFVKGAVATVMATPCGGPFLGALLAWALLQSPFIIFLIFSMIGVGMAIPYVLLSASKRLAGLLPKPGKWMDDFKHLMGFFLLAFAVHLLTGQNPAMIVVTVGICLSILFGVSINKRFSVFGMSLSRRLAVALLSIGIAVAGSIASFVWLSGHSSTTASVQESREHSDWEVFSPSVLKQAHEKGKNVVINFTASWCTSCQVNKAVVLGSREASELYKKKNVLLLTADLTNSNPAAESLLHHLGSRSVPFLAVFPAESPERPSIMRDILKKKQFLTVLDKLK